MVPRARDSVGNADVRSAGGPVGGGHNPSGDGHQAPALPRGLGN